MFVQNLIKLSTAVHELGYPVDREANKKT